VSNIISKNNKCPFRDKPHKNLAYVVYSTGDWCYSCNRGEIRSEDFYSFRGSKEAVTVNQKLILPGALSNNVKEMPLALKAWLYSYYVFDDLIYKYNIHHCPYNYFTTSNGLIYEGESLIFPLIIDNEIVAYQQRFFPNKQFFSCKSKEYIAEFGNHNSNTVVLVEDYLSAIRVAEVENSIWIQGTGLTNKELSYIIKNYLNIYVWLDPDNAGQDNAMRIFDKLTKEIEKLTNWAAFAILESRIIRNIKSNNDPKCYSNSEINTILKYANRKLL
jgi:5S rRNA maturation endonuclease (ribonuclease M5)